MLVTAVSGVYNGNGRFGRSDKRCAFLGMTDGTDICITGNYANRIGNTLTLGG